MPVRILREQEKKARVSFSSYSLFRAHAIANTNQEKVSSMKSLI